MKKTRVFEILCLTISTIAAAASAYYAYKNIEEFNSAGVPILTLKTATLSKHDEKKEFDQYKLAVRIVNLGNRAAVDVNAGLFMANLHGEKIELSTTAADSFHPGIENIIALEDIQFELFEKYPYLVFRLDYRDIRGRKQHSEIIRRKIIIDEKKGIYRQLVFVDSTEAEKLKMILPENNH